MPKTANERIKRLLGPDERPSVLFSANRPLPRGSSLIQLVPLNVVTLVVAAPLNRQPSVLTIATVAGAWTVVLMVFLRLHRLFMIGVVGDDIVVVRPGRTRDRLVGRWPPQAANPAILGKRFIRIRVAGVKYWVESDDAVRARLAVNNVNRLRAAIDC